jgi:UDP-N-acetylmuramoyl-tripeptide--D-alanyl-D-alanine ligase (fragment)
MQLLKHLLEKILGSYVKKYLKSHSNVKLITVVGSVGKTSVKSATATVLSEKFTVRHSRGNLNTTLSAPLEILGIDGPKNVKSPLDWLKVFSAARSSIKNPQSPDIIIQECGIDCPGEMATFMRYVQPDIAIITSVAPEHMEFFKTIDVVAREELSISQVAKKTIFNFHDIDKKYHSLIIGEKISYGDESADVLLQIKETTSDGYIATLRHNQEESHDISISVLGKHNIRSITGAAAAGLACGMNIDEVAVVLTKIKPVSGRMNILRGAQGCTLLDDTYNASPVAMENSLKTLYSLETSRKIAVLGDMNELGDSSKLEHEKIGRLCDPKQLDLLITVGKLAKKHLAPIAEKNGCKVLSFDKSPEAGEFLKIKGIKDSTILFKGSQGGIYLEEAIKPLLNNPADSQKLVRQSETWLKKKQQFFDQPY